MNIIRKGSDLMENAIRSRLLSKTEALLYTLTAGVIIFIGFILLKYPDSATKGVTEGIELCLGTLIPSILPFMFVSCFLLESGILWRTGRLFSFIGERIFGLPGYCAPVIFFSMIAGLPVGARLTEELYVKGMITKTQGQRMLFFCMNPGPAFVITGVGQKMLGSRELGIIIYASLIISSLLIGILSVPVWSDENEPEKTNSDTTKPELAPAVVRAVSVSGRSVFGICAWVVLFSCLTELIKTLGFSENTQNFLFAITEVTNGCRRCAEIYPAPVIAGIIGFGGFCAHMQVATPIMTLKLEYKYFISARILNGGISVLITLLLLRYFPVAVETSAFGSVPEETKMAMSYPICAGIMLMCFLMLLGDNFRIKKRIK